MFLQEEVLRKTKLGGKPTRSTRALLFAALPHSPYLQQPVVSSKLLNHYPGVLVFPRWSTTHCMICSHAVQSKQDGLGTTQGISHISPSRQPSYFPLPLTGRFLSRFASLEAFWSDFVWVWSLRPNNVREVLLQGVIRGTWCNHPCLASIRLRHCVSFWGTTAFEWLLIHHCSDLINYHVHRLLSAGLWLCVIRYGTC